MPYQVSGFFVFPLPVFRRALVQADVALMPAAGDLPGSHRLQNGAPLLLAVGAAYKAAVVQIGSEFPEAPGQQLCPPGLQSVRIKGGKPGRIRYHRAVPEPEKFHMAGGMPAAAQLTAGLAGL